MSEASGGSFTRLRAPSMRATSVHAIYASEIRKTWEADVQVCRQHIDNQIDVRKRRNVARSVRAIIIGRASRSVCASVSSIDGATRTEHPNIRGTEGVPSLGIPEGATTVPHR